MILALTHPLGTGDCEALGSGWLLQPVEAWTSLAYTLVGIVLIVAARRTASTERTLRITFGVLMAATGIGSFLYHGPQSAGAGFVHDVTFLATLWFVALMDPASSHGIRRRTAWLSFGAVGATVSVLLLLIPSSTNVLTGLAIVALVLSDVLMHRIGGIDGRWYSTALALFAISLLFNVLGRSAAPTCDPDSLLQFHALWHVFSAGALGAYFVSMTVPRNQEPT
ncbi:MAG: hypothetical protein WCC01_14275 [Acidimicrobiia bacterium]